MFSLSNNFLGIISIELGYMRNNISKVFICIIVCSSKTNTILLLERLGEGGGGGSLIPPCGFSKTVFFSREGLKSYCFVVTEAKLN